MADLIDTVASLIDERDREDLEVTLARATFEMSRARALTFWRVFRRVDGVWLRKRLMLPETFEPAETVEDDVPLVAASECLRLAYESRNVVRWRDRPGCPKGCALPVQGANEVLGLIEIAVDADLDRHRLAALAGMLRIYRSHQAALDYGDIDELTRLANRRTFDDQFARFVQAEARRHGVRRIADGWGARSHLGVADIDFFKQVNDRFGHPYGDEVLVLFSRLMRDTFRDTDKLFRFGGEEFVILMSNSTLDDALAAFERFRAAVEAYHFPQVGQVTVSIGVTSLRLHDNGSAAFGRADQALYAAKRRGRNRIMLHEALQESPALESMRKASSEIELF
ncbi:MAG: diguanylate cyclase [Pseudomonadota bacterium]|nr:diguanylate cyclase [Pseudomonadota bacterium]